MHPIISLDSSIQVSPVIEWKQAFLNFAKLYVISLIKNEIPLMRKISVAQDAWVALLVKKNFCDLCNHKGRRRPYLKSDTCPLLPPCIPSLRPIKLWALSQNIRSLWYHDWSLRESYISFKVQSKCQLFFENFLTSKYDAPWCSITLLTYFYHHTDHICF